MRIFYILPIIYAVLHLYAFIDLRRGFGSGLWQLPVLVWFCAMIAVFWFRFGKSPDGFMAYVQTVSFIWLGFIFILIGCLIVTDLASLLLKILSLASHKLAGIFPGRRSVPLALALAIGLSLWALYEAHQIRVTRVTIPVAELPNGMERLRIAHLTDIHISPDIGNGKLENIVNLVRAEKPDMIVFTGDLVDIDVSRRDDLSAILAGLEAPLGTFAVTGNHEAYRGEEMAVAFMERSGMRVLRGETVKLGDLAVTGVDDPVFAGRGIVNTTTAKRPLDYVQDNALVLLLKHRPDLEPGTAGLFDLQLSGHTHGGQIWPGRYLVAMINNMPQGLSIFPPSGEGTRKSHVWVSNGTGFWGPPMRLFTPPEICIVDLVQQ